MTLASLIGIVTSIALLVIPIVASIVLIAFFWNFATLLFNVSDTEKIKQAKQRIVWAVITMFVLFTIGGIVALLGNYFFGSNQAAESSGPRSFNSGSLFNTGVFNSGPGMNPGTINPAPVRNPLPTPNETPP